MHRRAALALAAGRPRRRRRLDAAPPRRWSPCRWQGQIFHEFHQLPTLPPLALYFGMGAAPLFDGRTYARLTGLRRPLAVAAVAALLAVGRRARLRRQRRDPPALSARPAQHAAGGRRRGHRRAHAEGRAAGDGGVRALRQQLADAALLRASQGLELRSGVDLRRASSSTCGPSAASATSRSTDWPALEAARADVIEFLQPFPHVDLPYTQRLVSTDRPRLPPPREPLDPAATAGHAMLVRR